METQTVLFLDYEITTTGNGDGWVLMANDAKLKQLAEDDDDISYQYHLGNFSDVESAKQSAIIHFMIERPKDFHQSIHNRIMHGHKSGTQYEWFKLRDVLKRENITMPSELAEPYDPMNLMIGYNRKPLHWKSEN